VKRPRARFHDLSSLIIGAKDKPSQTGRRVPQVRIPNRKEKYKGQCPLCGGSKVISSKVPGITLLCPNCTGYQQCGL
jgi:hypothetical protein